jgi:hypothetical protein
MVAGTVDPLTDAMRDIATKYGWIYMKQTQNDNLTLLL